jgi:hypothetical protein
MATCNIRQDILQSISSVAFIPCFYLTLKGSKRPHPNNNNNNNNNLDWGPVPHFYPLEALQPVWLTPEVYCTIPVFLIVPTLAARCLSRPQPAVVP